MFRSALLTAVLVLALTSAPVTAAPMAAVPLPTVPMAADDAESPVEVIVVFDDANSVNRSAVTAVGGTVVGGEDISLVPVLFARVDEDAIPRLSYHPDVVTVDRNEHLARSGQTVPRGIRHINATTASGTVEPAHEAAVDVAILDTGIDADHPDLQPNVAWGVNTVGKEPIRYGLETADDDNGHGTHVAGIAAAADNAVGVVGVAPSARLYAVKVLDGSGTGTYRDLIEGLDAALVGPDGVQGTDDDADVISMSLGGTASTRSLRQAVDAAAEHAVVVAAAGNTGDGDGTTDNVTYPARYSAVIAVAATDENDRTARWSGEGDTIEVAAPGVGVNSTSPDGTFSRLSGTSMAAPHVAGTAALLVARDLEDGSRDLRADDLRSRLRDTALDIESPGRDSFSGYGRIRANAAVGTTVVPLTAAANESSVAVGDTVAVTVRRADTDGAVAGATVAAGGVSKRTDDQGRAVFSFDTAGAVEVTASKQPTTFESFDDDAVTITVAAYAEGDVNRDGTVGALDATLVQRRIVGASTHETFDRRRADVNDDGAVDAVDAQLILRLWTGTARSTDFSAP